MARWQSTYAQWRKGKNVFEELPRATAYRHRAIIQRVYGADIRDRQQGFSFGQEQLDFYSPRGGQ